jgi:hypothetical protein
MPVDIKEALNKKSYKRFSMKKENIRQEQNDNKQSQEEHHINPFEKTQNTAESKETIEEQAAAEQQRKEALTERD